MDKITERLLNHPAVGPDTKSRARLVAAAQEAEAEGDHWAATNLLRRLSLDGKEDE